MPSSATKAMRFEFRIQSDDKRAVEAAAELVHQAPSDFVREAAVERAASVIEAHLAKTIVQADFFDALLDSLDQPSLPNAALRSAASRQHQVVKRDR